MPGRRATLAAQRRSMSQAVTLPNSMRAWATAPPPEPTSMILAGQTAWTNRLDPLAPADQRREINPQPHPRDGAQRARDVTRSDAALPGPSRKMLDPFL